jgi:pimeloyl-ACP methyl ester carboxylesterase
MNRRFIARNQLPIHAEIRTKPARCTPDSLKSGPSSRFLPCKITRRAFQPMLAHAGYRVIAPDQIGFCKSTKPEHYQ